MKYKIKKIKDVNITVPGKISEVDDGYWRDMRDMRDMRELRERLSPAPHKFLRIFGNGTWKGVNEFTESPIRDSYTGNYIICMETGKLIKNKYGKMWPLRKSDKVQ